MKTINEYRVRPVVRWNLTHYHQTVGENTAGAGVRSLGEFASEQQAEELKAILENAAAPKQYALVSLEFDAPATVYYADSEPDAGRLREKLQAETGKDFRIFSRSI